MVIASRILFSAVPILFSGSRYTPVFSIPIFPIMAYKQDDFMTRLRPILTIILMLMQSVSQAARHTAQDEAHCETGCCAGFAEDCEVHCSCVGDTDNPSAPTPLPPPTRREIHLPVLVALPDEMSSSPIPARPLDLMTTGWSEPSPLIRSNVRLAVLFCSLLI
jgi:hypothetical protein